MNRRAFFTRCLAGAVLGVAKHLPMPPAFTFNGVPVHFENPLTSTEILTGIRTAMVQAGARLGKAAFFIRRDVYDHLHLVGAEAEARAVEKRARRAALRLPTVPRPGAFLP